MFRWTVFSRISEQSARANVIAWGSYDESKPRVRLLLDELQAQGALSAQINIPVWRSVRDKAVVGRARMSKALLRLVASYPAALLKLLKQPPRGSVLLAYPAIPDIFAVWPVARLRGNPIIFDAFISLYDTVVADRAIVGRDSFIARLIWCAEWLALHLADIILVDTDQHGDFFAKEFGIPRERFQTMMVGAERKFWNSRGNAPTVSLPPEAKSELPTILFYGQLIPLHGLDTILDAVVSMKDDPIHWLLIGSGQEEPKLRRFVAEHADGKMTWLPWIDYEQLPTVISHASIALGIFGSSDKAARVIPNKAFQVLAAGKPLITRESPAIEPLVKRYPRSIRTVPAGSGAALANAVRDALDGLSNWEPVPASAAGELGPGTGVQGLLARLS